jgi:hypothetical protein
MGLKVTAEMTERHREGVTTRRGGIGLQSALLAALLLLPVPAYHAACAGQASASASALVLMALVMTALLVIG